MASSSNGIKLATAVYNGNVYTSTNSGGSWTMREPAGAGVPRLWYCIASSSDGNKLAAVAQTSVVYISTNSGLTWTKPDPTGMSAGSWYGLASSSDGTKLAVGGKNNRFYTSTDSGLTWTRRYPAGNLSGNSGWFGITSSSDGTKLATVDYYGSDTNGGYVYSSTDSGVTWTKREPAGAGIIKNWWSIASSSDGTKLVAGAETDYIYTSASSW